MEWALLVFWGAVGWCGNEPRWPKKPWPNPPDPWWNKLVAIAGGIIGGWAFDSFFPGAEQLTRSDVVATAVGAFVGSIVLSSLSDLITRNITGSAEGKTAAG